MYTIYLHTLPDLPHWCVHDEVYPHLPVWPRWRSTPALSFSLHVQPASAHFTRPVLLLPLFSFRTTLFAFLQNPSPIRPSGPKKPHEPAAHCI
jgi:hypothetical protein